MGTSDLCRHCMHPDLPDLGRCEILDASETQALSRGLGDCNPYLLPVLSTRAPCLHPYRDRLEVVSTNALPAGNTLRPLRTPAFRNGRYLRPAQVRPTGATSCHFFLTQLLT